MRNYLMGLLVSACMFGQSALASGFCDNTQLPNPPKGGGDCQQTRGTEPIGDALPSYSDLDLSTYWDDPNGPTILFTLDIGLLYSGVTALDEQHIEVLELGLGQFSHLGSTAGNVSGEHVLTITVDRLPSGSWSLGYAWLAAPANWSIVNAKFMPNIEAAGESTLFTPDVTRVVVEIRPTRGLQQLVVSAQPSGPGEFMSGSPATFDMPPVPTAARNLPVRLRTGVLGGDLRAAIQTHYVFISPLIANGQ
jgi:hypothetical protein